MTLIVHYYKLELQYYLCGRRLELRPGDGDFLDGEGANENSEKSSENSLEGSGSDAEDADGD